MTRKPNDSDQPVTRSQHYAEIIRPDTLGQWAIEKNPTLQYLHEAMHDWGERQGDSSRRPVCMACPLMDDCGNRQGFGAFAVYRECWSGRNKNRQSPA